MMVQYLRHRGSGRVIEGPFIKRTYSRYRENRDAGLFRYIKEWTDQRRIYFSKYWEEISDCEGERQFSGADDLYDKGGHWEKTRLEAAEITIERLQLQIRRIEETLNKLRRL